MRILNRRRVLLAAVILASCGPRLAHAAQIVKVRIPSAKTAFDPAEVRIKVGDTVEWTNRSVIPHTVTCDPAKAKDQAIVKLPPGAPAFDSGVIGEDGVFTHLFTKAGTYKYFCIEHQAMGMAASVIVEA